MSDQDKYFMQLAIDLARSGMELNEGGPFGAIIVDKEGQIRGKGNNKVTSSNDPTAHAEVVAIRDACAHLGHFQLEGCTIYSSCEPCPMCLGAIYWARPQRLVFAANRKDAALIGFDDEVIYQEISLPVNERQIKTDQILQEEGIELFKVWMNKENKIEY